MNLIVPITVELGDGSDTIHDGTATWHPRARGYGEQEPPADESVVVNVVASGIETGVYAASAIAGLTTIAEHLEQVAAHVHELVRHLERDQTVGYQRTAHELESDMRRHARKFTRAEADAILAHERLLDQVARTAGVGIQATLDRAIAARELDRLCMCGELATVDRPCNACNEAAARAHRPSVAVATYNIFED